MVRVVVSGIPRGYHYPRPDGNWLQEKHITQIKALSPEIELLEIPANQVMNHKGVLKGFDVLLAEGGNRDHYEGELDWEDYCKFFTPQLKWVQLCSTGFSDNITPEIINGLTTLTNSPGIHTIPIAESVVAAMLEHAKKFGQRRLDQANRLWRQVKCNDLEGSTILLIGLGNIGGRIAMLCKAFGMNVIGTRRRSEPVPNVDIVFPNDELALFIPQADFIVVVSPLTPETEGLLSRELLNKMKKTSYFINVGRGRVADENALIDILKEKRISGAYLDCFGVEPLPNSHPFWRLENVFLVPHDSHSSPKIGDRLVDQFCENLRRYVNGSKLQNICDPRRGY